MGKKEWKKIRHGIIIFVMAFFSAIPFVVYGKNIDSKETICIGYIDYGGFIDLDENGEYTGYGVELLDKIAEYTGWKYEYVYVTWDNVLKKLESGEIDMICQAQKTPEREERFLLSKYWAGTEACVLYARMDDDRYYYNDYEAFNGIRVAGLKESFQNDDLKEYAQKNDFSFELKEYMTTEECFQALEEGAVDAVVQGSLVGMDDYKIICRFGAQPFYLMAGKQKQKVMEDADYALGEITADYPTFLSELYQKYYGDTSAMGLAFTREEIEYIRAQKQVNIAFINNRPPFSMENDDGEIEGIIVDLVSRIRESSGLNLQYTMLESGQRVIDYLEKHPADLVAGVVVENPAFTKSDYLVSDVIYTGEVALVCRQGMNYTPGDAENKYILAITKSYAALENYIQRKQYQEVNLKLQKLYRIDQLTGIYNRFGMEDLGQKFYEKNCEYHVNTKFIFCDINRLKYINDTYGHKAGDWVIRKTGEALGRLAAEDSLPFRFGGDEFLLLTREESGITAESIRQSIAVVCGEETSPIRESLEVSIGVILAPWDSEYNMDVYLNQADEAMYEEKKMYHEKYGDRRRR